MLTMSAPEQPQAALRSTSIGFGPRGGRDGLPGMGASVKKLTPLPV
jgi:hypothetical protein